MSIRVRYLLTTIALVAIGLGYVLVQQWPRHSALRLPARAEASSHPVPRPSLPTAREILEHGVDLALTPDQRGRLTALDRQWKQESAGVQAVAEAAGRDLSQFLQEQGSGKVSLQEIQRRSADYRGLSQELRELRQRHAEATRQVLTDPQRQTLATIPSPHISGGEQ
ncbi:MAG TPA: Spy/CpxP family protein refolding chaperone [Candidatus Methylomirabilis sp.]|nr:Spy/CpxP family protein refolding chaperone [Candidatus Methylomirabilis sp.]